MICNRESLFEPELFAQPCSRRTNIVITKLRNNRRAGYGSIWTHKYVLVFGLTSRFRQAGSMIPECELKRRPGVACSRC